MNPYESPAEVGPLDHLSDDEWEKLLRSANRKMRFWKFWLRNTAPNGWARFIVVEVFARANPVLFRVLINQI